MAELEDIANLPGFGPSKIDSFKNAGYRSLEDLRGITWDELGDVKGIKSSAKRRAILNFLEDHNLREKLETEEKYKKFRSLLEELFQFESADLDFGVYRIMNAKRDRIEDFLDEELQEKVKNELEEFQATEQGEAQARLEAAKEQIKKDFPHWIDDHGNIKDEALPDDPQGIAKERKDEYLEAKSEAEKAEIGESTEAAIYQDLYRFFKRYYEDGDFIPQRRAANQEKYAIPYNGEEVKLHWANKDQYFVKTGEKFKDYKFRKDSYDIEFKLHNAHIEKSNKKGDNKYFVLRDQSPIEQEDRHLTVHFEYRPLREADYDEYNLSESSQSSTYKKKIRDHTEEKILSEVSNKLEKILNKNTDNTRSNSTVIQKHLKNYRTKNKQDYFIHKDLSGFLEQELDFYLKNEVFSWKEMTDHNGEIPARVRARLNAIENIAQEIIDFVAEIEDYQKKLFEKRKFVYQTDYMITLDNVPEELYDEILDNQDQLNQWQKVYSTNNWDINLAWSGEFDREILKKYPSLMVDTAFFEEKFKLKILSSFDNIKESIDGRLINAENWQAMNLLEERYLESIGCIYIDPPYNTGKNKFVYKDNYRRSSWISMMKDRVEKGERLLSQDGLFFSSISDQELDNLNKILNISFGEEQHISNLIWHTEGHTDNQYPIKVNHEYIPAYAKDENEADIGYVIDPNTREESNLWKGFAENSITKNGSANPPRRVELPKGFPVKVESLDLETNKPPEEFFEEVEKTGYITRGMTDRYGVDYPIRFDRMVAENGELVEPCTVYTGWANVKKLKKFINRGFEPIKEEDGETTFYISKNGVIYYHKDRDKARNIYSVLRNMGTTEQMSYQLEDMGLDYDYPKPKELISYLIQIGAPNSDDVVMDFFAGSGTTAEAVINLNQEKDKNLNYVLVEMADYFDTVLRPRIQKIIFSNEWEDNTPENVGSSSQVVKYQRLEDYEDTLNNLNAREDQTRVEDFTSNTLEYFLNFEVDGESLLNIDGFKSPFNYEMYIREGDEAKKETIDLIETFNYLLGLEVRSIQQLNNNDRKYRIVTGEKDHNKITVVWRPVEDDDGEEFFEEDREFLKSNVLGDEDIVYVNYDSALPDAKSIEKTFQNRMWE